MKISQLLYMLSGIFNITFFSHLFLQWFVQTAIATEGKGLYEGLDWLSNEIAKIP